MLRKHNLTTVNFNINKGINNEMDKANTNRNIIYNNNVYNLGISRSANMHSHTSHMDDGDTLSH